ncbi:MAG: ribonuclease III [Luminiphilus sp.]
MTRAPSKISLAELQQRIGYQFHQTDLLLQALTHRSASKTNNERLEFVGDSVVNHVVAVALFSKYPKVSEGELSRRRTHFVRGSFLAQIAIEWSLGDYLILGTGERKSGGRHRESILGDAVEAIAGAILLDSNLQQTAEVVLSWFQTALDQAAEGFDRDPKTQLQEWLQARQYPLPEYRLVSTTGPDHDQTFRVACKVKPFDTPFHGEGRSRREAEQEAASAALSELGDE